MFGWNRPGSFGKRLSTDRQTDRQTDTLTDNPPLSGTKLPQYIHWLNVKTHHLPMYNNFDFGGYFWRKTCANAHAVLNKTGNYRPILLIFIRKHGVPLCYVHHVQIWEKKSDQNYDCESAAYETCNMAATTSSHWDIQNLWIKTLVHVLETICVKFHQNRPSRFGFRAVIDRQTDT